MSYREPADGQEFELTDVTASWESPDGTSGWVREATKKEYYFWLFKKMVKNMFGKGEWILVLISLWVGVGLAAKGINIFMWQYWIFCIPLFALIYYYAWKKTTIALQEYQEQQFQKWQDYALKQRQEGCLPRFGEPTKELSPAELRQGWQATWQNPLSH